MMGPDLLTALLTEGSSRIRVLIRSGAEPAVARFNALLGLLRSRGTAETDLGRLTLVDGDLARDDLGVTAGAYRKLTNEIRSILHGAAATRFSLPIETARAANVDTTRNVIGFARDCSHLERFGFLSTAYVAGVREGRILEGDLVPTEFVNTYEQTKHEAERDLRAATDLPIAIYRLSTVIGSSETGWVPKMGAIHRAVELAYRGLIPMVPGDADTSIDLIDLEYATGAVARLFSSAFTPGMTYHLVAGPDLTFTLEEFIEANHEIVAAIDPAWASRGIEIPPIVDGAVFEMLRTMISTVADPEGAAVLGALNNFVPQLLHPKEFDTTNRDAALSDSVRPRATRDYYAKIVRHCLETDWGRIPVEALR